jgi:glucose-6-phosphate-specific signal transduction histidine kinase
MYLHEIYKELAGDPTILDEESSNPRAALDVKTEDSVLSSVKLELHDKLKNVQNATAIRVLNRFCKKPHLVD